MNDLTTLQQDEPPKDRQILAWAFAGQDRLRRHDPRWCVVQWNNADYAQYWEWSVPGYSTSVEILGWMELPWNDFYADAMFDRNKS